MKIKKNKYDLVALENKLNFHYTESLEKDCEDSKINFFKAVQDLAYAILEVSKYKVDFDEISHDYATAMYERVYINGERFTTSTDRVPFTQYIRLNIRGLVFPKSNREIAYKDLLDDLKFIVDDGQNRETTLSQESDYRALESLGSELHDAMLKFYSQEEIKQKLGLTLDMIFDTNFQPIPRGIPKDLQLFSITLICLAKRLARDNNLNLINNRSASTINNALDSSLRSSSFLALISDNKNNLPLFLSVDIDSLYRLATVAGGTRITVPSLRILSNLTNASVVASSVIKNGKRDKLSYKDVSKISQDFDIKTSNDEKVSCSSLQKTVSKALDIYDTLGPDEKSNPIIQTLGYSVSALEKLSDNVDGDSIETILSYLDRYTEAIANIKNKLQGVQV